MKEPAGQPSEAASSDETTVTAVLASYAEAGFAGSFMVTSDGEVTCGACTEAFAPEQLDELSLRRLEGASDPADMLAVVAFGCPRCGARGTLLLNYGPEASAEQATVLRQLHDRRGEGSLPDSQTPDEQAVAERSPS